jgi:hypothetical protein
LDIAPLKCIYNDETTLPAAGLLYQRGSGGSQLTLKNITLIVERADGSVVSKEGSASITPTQSLWAAITGAASITSANLPQKFKVAASFKNANGKIVTCPPSREVVKCVKRGIGITGGGVVNVIASNSIAQSINYPAGYSEGSGYQTNSLATLAETTGNGIVIVYISSLTKPDNGIAKNSLTIIDSNGLWTNNPGCGVGQPPCSARII